MPVVTLPLFLHLVLQAGAPITGSPEEMTVLPRIVVTAETPPREHEVRISSGRGLLLVFDAPVRREALLLQDRERFRQLSLSEDGLVLTLLPRADLPMGRRFGLSVRFVDGEVPASLDFLLVVHPEAESQVEVYRRPRPGASYQREAEELRTQLAQCQTTLNQERTGRQAPLGVVGLLVTGQLRPGGILGRRINRELAFRQEDALRLDKADSYRVRGFERAGSKEKVVLDLRVIPTGQEPWRPMKAQLVSEGGRWAMDLWVFEPRVLGEPVRLVAEVELPEAQVPTGPSQLRLWDEAGTRLAVLSGVTFPSAEAAVVGTGP